MPSASVSVRRSRPDQGDLRGRAEHASARPDLLRAVGLDVGRQAIIRRDSDTFALYTLTDCRDRGGGRHRPHGSRWTRAARRRRRSSSSVPTWTAWRSTRPPPRRRPGEARSSWSCSMPATVQDCIVLAPHGGDIEPFTDLQAEHVRTELCRSRRELLALQGIQAQRRGRGPMAHHLDRHQHRQLPPARDRRRRGPSVCRLVPRVHRGGASRHPDRRGGPRLRSNGWCGRSSPSPSPVPVSRVEIAGSGRPARRRRGQPTSSTGSPRTSTTASRSNSSRQARSGTIPGSEPAPVGGDRRRRRRRLPSGPHLTVVSAG